MITTAIETKVTTTIGTLEFKAIEYEPVFDGEVSNTPTSLGLHSIVRSYKEKIENSDTIFHKEPILFYV